MPARDQPRRARGRPNSGSSERVGERLIALFLLGVVLINPLVIDVFDRGPETTVLGVPLLFVYLFAAWAGLILLLAWVIERAERPRRSPAAHGDGGPVGSEERAGGR